MVEVKFPEIEKIEKKGVEVPVNKKVERILRVGFGYTPFDYGEDTNEEDVLNLRKNQPLIKEILETYDKSTNNDVILYFEFLRMKLEDIEVTSSKDNVIFKIPKKIVKYIPSPETVTRCRRVLNKKGIGLPTDNSVFIRRMKRQASIRKYFKDRK
jgi:hypothetical protein